MTGATKGIGRGIAVQLGQAGAKVYVTGRTKEKLDGCAAEITRRGGKGVGVCVDHGEDDQVKELFERIDRENNGRYVTELTNLMWNLCHHDRLAYFPLDLMYW